MLIDIHEAKEILNNGGVIGIQTDTVYGFCCLERYQNKIYELKNRDPKKKLIQMISNINYFDIKYLDPSIIRIMNDIWPGDTTLILDYKNQNIGYRIPKVDNIINLIELLDDKMICTTSANISGKDPICDKKEFIKHFPNIPLLKNDKIIMTKRPSKILEYKNNEIIKIR